MKKNFISVLIFFIITGIYFAPVIFSPKTFIARDNYMFYNPKHFFAAESIKSGTIPLWDPYLAGGVPFQANVQSCVFYPPSLLYYVLPFQTGYKYFIILHYFLGGLFVLLLMRAWGYDWYAALISGIVFSFSGYLVSIQDNVCFLCSAVWLPLIVLLHHHALKTGSFYWSLLGAIGISLQILAGDASFYVFSTFLCLFLYTLLWPAVNGAVKTSGWRIKPWLQVLCTMGAGLALSSVQLIPMFELVSNSTRFDGLSYETVTRWSYHPLEFLQLLVPYVFGATVPMTRWFGQLWLDTFYCGIFPLIFVIYGMFYSKDTIRYFILPLLACSLLLGIGEYNPLYKFFYNYFPVINMIQFPVKFLFAGAFCFSILAGIGASQLLARLQQGDMVERYLKQLAVFFLVLLAVLGMGTVLREPLYRYFLTMYPTTEYFQTIKKISFTELFNGLSIAIILFGTFFLIIGAVRKGKLRVSLCKYLVAAVILADLFFVGKPQEPYIDESLFTRENPTVSYLQRDSSLFRILPLAALLHKQSYLHYYAIPFEPLYKLYQQELAPNLNIYYHIQSINFFQDVVHKDYLQIVSRIEDYFAKAKQQSTENTYEAQMLNLLNVKYIISPFKLEGFPYRLVLDDKIKIYQNPRCLPRAFFAEQLVPVESEAVVLEKMKHASFDPATMVYIAQPELAKLRGEPIPAGAARGQEHFAGSIEFVAYRPNDISLRVKTNEARLLVLSDNFYPGWRAYINGKEKPIVKVNYTLRGLLIDRGEHEVMFVFKPRSFFIGAIISLITLAGVCIGLVTLKKDGPVLWNGTCQ